MPRIVVLEFDSAGQVETYFQHTQHDPGRVIGEYYFPGEKVYCKCDPKTRVRGDNWRRHSKLGLWVCKRCGKPSRAWRLGLMSRLDEALGKNQRPR